MDQNNTSVVDAMTLFELTLLSEHERVIKELRQRKMGLCLVHEIGPDGQAYRSQFSSYLIPLIQQKRDLYETLSVAAPNLDSAFFESLGIAMPRPESGVPSTGTELVVAP